MFKNAHVTGKLGNMRKSVEWIVYPPSNGERSGPGKLFVQSDKRAVAIDVATKKGMLSNGKGHPGFISTLKILGAVEIDIPDDFLQQCLNAQPHSGDVVAGGNGTPMLVIG